MRVVIESLADGEFKAIGYGLAQSGSGEPIVEVIDVEVHARPTKQGGSCYKMSGFLCGARVIKGTSPLSPKELAESYQNWFDENSANSHFCMQQLPKPLYESFRRRNGPFPECLLHRIVVVDSFR